VNNLTHYRPAIPSGNRKKIEDLFSSALSQFKTYHPSGDMKLKKIRDFPKLKIAYFSEKNPSIFS